MELLKALLSCCSGLVVVAAGWLVGQRLTYGWSVRQKRRELQLGSVQQFYSAYGEFFAVWKLWNRLANTTPDVAEKQWELQKRAAAAEAIVESLMVKMSAEANLSAQQILSLGCYRQAFQQLRQVIRRGDLLEWHSSDTPQYLAFKTLAVEIAQILGTDWSSETVAPDQAIRQLQQITSNQWESTWDNYSARRPA